MEEAHVEPDEEFWESGAESDDADVEVTVSQDQNSIASIQELGKLFHERCEEGCGKCVVQPSTTETAEEGLGRVQIHRWP